MAFPTKPRIEWSADHDSADPRLCHANVARPEDLERILDRLAEEAATTKPFIAELLTLEGGRLGIGLGKSESVLTFKESDDPPYFLSVGRPASDGDDDVGFYFQGRWSEFPASSLVPSELARDATRHFASTGERPDVVQWEEV